MFSTLSLTLYSTLVLLTLINLNDPYRNTEDGFHTPRPKKNDDDNQDMVTRIKKIISSFQEGFVRSFIDYGPPYADADEDLPPFGLITICAEFKMKLFELHGLLNQRANPNDR